MGFDYILQIGFSSLVMKIILSIFEDTQKFPVDEINKRIFYYQFSWVDRNRDTAYLFAFSFLTSFYIPK